MERVHNKYEEMSLTELYNELEIINKHIKMNEAGLMKPSEFWKYAMGKQFKRVYDDRFLRLIFIGKMTFPSIDDEYKAAIAEFVCDMGENKEFQPIMRFYDIIFNGKTLVDDYTRITAKEFDGLFRQYFKEAEDYRHFRKVVKESRAYYQRTHLFPFSYDGYFMSPGPFGGYIGLTTPIEYIVRYPKEGGILKKKREENEKPFIEALKDIGILRNTTSS